ncbi:divalent metal cation transporter [Acidiferrimicrobium sp. IK]|uniref:NRAMP family divalent metal transporter n=1 Tax=Acidiferrimicrobium sp. IK TaxID=2871700 RepID=UPI0021CAF2A8|nr:NRAMP family divalent metal transporter [Acidiferrimicrobium sp. IK]MCU4185990.1 divalent metal cation transporter [Acidiferrimicrobium sp. IK]
MGALLAIVGPGVIVMVADNDAGSLATFAQAGQDYGLRLVWLLGLLGIALFVTQEMVARLGAVTGAGHARLIYERFGPRWGGFAVGDLLVLNVLTVMTEFIGLQFGLGYFGVSRWISVPCGAVALLAITALGDFRRWERAMWGLVGASLVVLPLGLVVGGAHGTGNAGGMTGAATGTGILFVVGMVGTTVAPWQLFFQQSNVVDKRITTRWIPYERADTALGTVAFLVVGLAVVAGCAAAFRVGPLHGNFIDGESVARGLRDRVGSWAGSVFAVALIDGSLLGASAVSLASSYALGDVRGTRHSLHRRWGNARTFYATYAVSIIGAAVAVLASNGSLGAVTLAVQALSGALFPSAAVFLLLLANDREVLGPHVNPRWLNVAASAALGGLILLSSVLGLTTVFPHLAARPVTMGIGGAASVALVAWLLLHRSSATSEVVAWDPMERRTWTMPPIDSLGRAPMSRSKTVGLVALRAYLLLTAALIAVRLARMVAP